jgi:hypothetical protein
MIFYISSRKLKIMSSNELLQQLAQALTQVLGGGSNSNGLGFCPIPENQNAVKFIFPGYTRQQPPYMHFLGEKDQRTGNSPHIPVPGDALKGRLQFINLIDVVSNGEDKQKLCFWIDCGSITYVLWLGWADAYGKLNNASESFLKALASLTPDELLEPFTFTLSRLIDKPSYDPSKGNPATAGKVLLVDVWKNSGERVFSEQGHMDANAAAGVIVRINQHLTGQAVLTPRQPKSKTVIQEPIPVAQPQPTQQQWGQQTQAQAWGTAPIPQNLPAPVPQPQPTQYQQPQNLPQPIPQTPPVVGGLTSEMAAQFQAQQAQQAQAAPIPTPPPAPIPQMTSDQMAQYQQFLAMQAQQSLTPPPQWGSVAPTPPQNGNGGGKINW